MEGRKSLGRKTEVIYEAGSQLEVAVEVIWNAGSHLEEKWKSLRRQEVTWK
jgi:hypothetical protein